MKNKGMMNEEHYTPISSSLSSPLPWEGLGVGCWGGSSSLLLLLLFLFTSCDKADNTYTTRAVSFTFSPTTSVPMLHSALNNMGEYVTVRVSGGRFLFHSLGGDATWPMTEIDRRTTRMGLSGFIIGLPTMPELGQTFSRPVCYELSCPNCYDEHHITRDLTLMPDGRDSCGLCHRIYDPNNQGIISSGADGKKLDRYHITYSGSVTNAVSVY